MKKPLPTFRKPPVDETAIGVQFVQLPLIVPHFGLFYETVRDRYPTIETHIPIMTRPEMQPDTTSIEFVQDPNFVRCWFSTEPKNFVLQLQRDRFLTNWRRIEESDVYPRYEAAVRPMFVRELTQFDDFVSKQLSTSIQPSQVEVTYINHIDNGEGWESIKKLHRYFPAWNPEGAEFLPPASMANIGLSYDMSPTGGKLSAKLQPVLRTGDGRKFLQLKLTATQPVSGSIQEVFEAADNCREWIVLGFAELTSLEMQKVWCREEEK